MRLSHGLLRTVLTATSLLVAGVCTGQARPRLSGELAWTIGYDPKNFDPAKVDDQESEKIRYLTAGVLLRLNRVTQKLEPRLAESWSISADGRTVTFHLKAGLRFSDGSTLTAKDVTWSIQRVLLPATAAPAAEEFLTPASVSVSSTDDLTVAVHLPKRIIGICRIFEEIAIEPKDRPSEGRVTAGPFVISEYRRLQYIRLRANPRYFEKDLAGVQLPYATGIRLDILNNAEQEIRLFQKGDYDIIEGLAPGYFELLKRRMPSAVVDLGPSLNTEQMWFNQASTAPLPPWEKQWFQSRAFRTAVTQAIHRSDLARLAYAGHATPAYGFVSPANGIWLNRFLSTPQIDLSAAKRSLAAAGFRQNGAVLEDATGHPVRFSILTNSGNAARSKMATLIQQDLSFLGMQVVIVSLDFPALIERLMHTQEYEACLLGLENVDPDPNAMANIWLSASPNHQWAPSEKTPATPWEAEIDHLIQVQASSPRDAERKQAVDRLQQIVADQQPFIYLVHPNALYAISPGLRGVQPTSLQPGLIWNVEKLRVQRNP